jgi:mRNA-degrading endonuclease RelE of RelBE toxin-antitoxin system
MNYRVVIKRKILRGIRKLPVTVQKKMKLLVDDLKENGPMAYNWPNYSKLSSIEYHCHLSKKWVACWRMEEGTIEIEVYYAGTRENAPY